MASYSSIHFRISPSYWIVYVIINRSALTCCTIAGLIINVYIICYCLQKYHKTEFELTGMRREKYRNVIRLFAMVDLDSEYTYGLKVSSYA